MHGLRRWMWVGTATAATVAALAWAFAPRPLPVETALAAVGPFERAIEEDGCTRVRDRYLVSAPLSGELARIALREGDAVTPATVLASLTPALAPMLDARTRAQLAAQVDTAEASLARTQARVARASTALAQARATLARDQGLARDRFFAASQLEASRLAVRAAIEELQGAQEEQHAAGHALDQARAAQAAIYRDNASPFPLRAPVAGRVLRVLHTSGGSVALGTPLLELGDTGRMEVVTELLTTDALQVVPGMPARIERWGGPTALRGHVRLVEPAGFTKVSALGVEEQRVNVLVDLDSPHAQWRALGDGYRVGVRIVVVARPAVLQVPASAVFPAAGAADGSGRQMAVFVMADGRARLRRIAVADRNGEQAWVADGLRAGERVILYPGDAVADGVRVRARPMPMAR